MKQHEDGEQKQIGITSTCKTDEIAYCPYCQTFETTLKKELRTHINSVHGPCPPYKCNQKSCMYASKKLYLLMLHLQTHSTEYNFKCTFDGCSFASTTVHKLKFHKSTAHGPDKQIQCAKCQKDFTTKASLQTHLDVVHAPANKLKVKLSIFVQYTIFLRFIYN